MRSIERRVAALERRRGDAGEPLVVRIVYHGPGIGPDGLVKETVRPLDGSPEYTRRVPPTALDWDLQAEARRRGRLPHDES